MATLTKLEHRLRALEAKQEAGGEFVSSVERWEETKRRIMANREFRQRCPDADAMDALADRIEGGTASDDDLAALEASERDPASVRMLAKLERMY